jgi:hypothetical protein
MVACHLNFQFQILALLKRTKELDVVHFIVDAPINGYIYLFTNVFNPLSFVYVENCKLNSGYKNFVSMLPRFCLEATCDLSCL